MQPTLLVFVLLTFSVCLATPEPITYTVCSGPGAIGKIDKVSISPNPVQPKVVTVVNATGTLSKTINKGATWKLSASYNKLTVLWKNGDLCEDSVINLPFWTGHIYITGLKCPQEKGQITIQESAEFSVKPLSGVYGIHAEMFDENQDQILCLDIDVPM